jgi:hypothetical protein
VINEPRFVETMRIIGDRALLGNEIAFKRELAVKSHMTKGVIWRQIDTEKPQMERHLKTRGDNSGREVPESILYDMSVSFAGLAEA